MTDAPAAGNHAPATSLPPASQKEPSRARIRVLWLWIGGVGIAVVFFVGGAVASAAAITAADIGHAVGSELGGSSDSRHGFGSGDGRNRPSFPEGQQGGRGQDGSGQSGSQQGGTGQSGNGFTQDGNGSGRQGGSDSAPNS